jgi:hypothetical protein
MHEGSRWDGGGRAPPPPHTTTTHPTTAVWSIEKKKGERGRVGPEEGKGKRNLVILAPSTPDFPMSSTTPLQVSA